MIPVYVNYNRDRVKKYQIKTTILQNTEGHKEVLKQALHPEAKLHVNTMFDNYKLFKENYLHANLTLCEKREDFIAIQFVEGETLENKMLKSLYKKDLPSFYVLLDHYLIYLTSFACEVDIIQQTLGQQDDLYSVFDALDVINKKCMVIANIDINFDNIIVDSNSDFVLIDYEWILKRPVPIDFIVFRALFHFYNKNYCHFRELDFDSISKHVGIDNTLSSKYLDIERQFQEHVVGPENSQYENRYLKKRMELRSLVDAQVVEYKDQEICEMINSRSWRLTAPLRKLSFNLNKFRIPIMSVVMNRPKMFLKRFVFSLISVIRLIPFTSGLRKTVKGIIARIFPPLLWLISTGDSNGYIKRPKKYFYNSDISNIGDNCAWLSSKFDVLLFSIINWDSRYQRPQHIATYFSRQGHRVFYLETQFDGNDTAFYEIKENIIGVMLHTATGCKVLYEKNFDVNINESVKQLDRLIEHFDIRDFVVIVEYPLWLPLVQYLKEKYNCFVMYDYLDLFSGFEVDNHLLEINDKKMLHVSDLVVATSEYLKNLIAGNSKKTIIVRNGTEFSRFHSGPDHQVDLGLSKPIIGYYGAIAEWFNVGIIEAIAQERPEWNIVLIGEASMLNQRILKRYRNVYLLGEKDYSELPGYLYNFDVCLIPFKADSDLIKATNPVKFYEYLAAGKKIVATEIPELIPYKDQYVYLTNDSWEFIGYIDKCVNNSDLLATKTQMFDFARYNDWQTRCAEIKTAIIQNHKLVSVVVVTYNNLELTMECLSSIFTKTGYPNYEIIIVDNNSQDGTPTYLRKIDQYYTNVSVIFNNKNVGFAKANNQGVKLARGEFIIILNNDTVVTRGWISNLVKHLEREPALGMICPVTNSIGNEAKINVDYKTIEQMEVFASEYTRNNFNKLYKELNVLALFCVALKREIIEEVGLLDESYGIGMFEDDDYSYRVKEKGYLIACAEDVFIHHYGRASFKKMRYDEYEGLFNTNKAIFEAKWKTEWTPHVYRPGVK